MTEHNPNLVPNSSNEPEQEPFIPPRYLLGLAGLGFLIALVVLLTQPSFGVVGFGGLAFGIIALVAWALMAPQEAARTASGRALRFGGTSVLVTVLLLAALAAVYVVARNLNVRYDLTESDQFSLTDESRAAMQSLGADPTIPNVRILAFYGPNQAGSRDRDTLLFEEYKQASGGKIDFEFLDPDQNFALAQSYNISREGAIAVVALGEDGTPDVENASTVNFLTQAELTNAILKVAAQGSFAAYFLVVDEGAGSDMSLIKQTLTTRYDWTVRDLPLVQLTGPEAEFQLGDPTRDGEVVVIPGGRRPLAAEELAILQNYLNEGGSLIIFAQPILNADGQTLATDPALNDYLFANFGVRFNADVVIDRTQAFQSPLIPVVTNLDSQNYITNNNIGPNAAVVFEAPNSITIAETLPANVQVSRLAQTSAESYAKSGVAGLLAGDEAALQRADTDTGGPLVVAAAAENTQTGARVVLFGSLAPGLDTYASLSGAANLDVGFNSLIWTTRFNEFFSTINIEQRQRPQDRPIFADQQTLRNISFITQWLLPFGLLALGGLVLWSSRERRREG